MAFTKIQCKTSLNWPHAPPCRAGLAWIGLWDQLTCVRVFQQGESLQLMGPPYATNDLLLPFPAVRGLTLWTSPGGDVWRTECTASEERGVRGGDCIKGTKVVVDKLDATSTKCVPVHEYICMHIIGSSYKTKVSLWDVKTAHFSDHPGVNWNGPYQTSSG